MSFLLARLKFYISSPFERVWEKGRFCHLAYLLLMNILFREIQTCRPYYVRADKERERELIESVDDYITCCDNLIRGSRSSHTLYEKVLQGQKWMKVVPEERRTFVLFYEEVDQVMGNTRELSESVLFHGWLYIPSYLLSIPRRSQLPREIYRWIKMVIDSSQILLEGSAHTKSN